MLMRADVHQVGGVDPGFVPSTIHAEDVDALVHALRGLPDVLRVDTPVHYPEYTTVRAVCRSGEFIYLLPHP